MKLHPSAQYPRGFLGIASHCGIKARGANDLALIASEVAANAAAVFTRNQVPGAPVTVGRELIKGGRLQAIVVNSRVSNVGRGQEGIDNARRMGAAAAKELGIDTGLVLMSSTGIIGAPLPIEKIEAGLVGLSARLENDPLIAARGIMTTDTHPKALSISVGDATLTAVAKGSGMIAPNMATMLVYLLTDAEIESAALDAMLRRTVDDTLNMLSIDSDTSTSDSCVILANGMAGPVDATEFEGALRHLMTELTEILARDGEGATRLLRIRVGGAEDRAGARAIARSINDSPLVKTMVHGGDPNVGRILMAVGKVTTTPVDPDRIDARIGGQPVLLAGRPTDFDASAVRAHLTSDTVEIEVHLGLGDGEARAWGCDLSQGYIEENGAYTST